MTETGYYILLALVTEQHGYGTLQKLKKEKLIRATAEVERFSEVAGLARWSKKQVQVAKYKAVN